MPVVGAGGERSGLAALVCVFALPFVAGFVLGSPDGPGVGGRSRRFDEPAVFLNL